MAIYGQRRANNIRRKKNLGALNVNVDINDETKKLITKTSYIFSGAMIVTALINLATRK